MSISLGELLPLRVLKILILVGFYYQERGKFISSIILPLRGIFAMISRLGMDSFKKIVVIGAGTMGQGIAAHLANSSRQVVLLDLKENGSPNQIAERALDIIKKSDFMDSGISAVKTDKGIVEVLEETMEDELRT